jgi:NAD+ synthase
MKMLFSSSVLDLDAAAETDQIAGMIRTQVIDQLRRKGVVIGLSGGIDSSVTAALCVRALGKDRVFGLLMPETDSSPDSLRCGRLVADSLGIRSEIEDMAPILKAAGCYQRRDKAIRTLVPQFTEEYKSKIVLPSLNDGNRYSIFSVVVRPPAGREIKARLTAEAYRGIVAATNFKQRARKMMEYYYADLLGYANAGTCNRLEHELGFFVKNGDGSADLKPIAHLYKSQVYQLASYLNTPEEIQRRPPTTDTYSMEQTQEEFYFSIPLDKMDLCLFGRNHNVAAEDVAVAVRLPVEQVRQVYAQIDSKRAATGYQRMQPLMVGKRGN